MKSKSDKAVSPIVAVVLIIIVAVSTSLIMHNWITGTSSTVGDVSKVGSERLVIKAAYLDPGTGEIVVYLQNIGTKPINVNTVYLKDPSGNIVYTWSISATVDPGHKGTVRLGPPSGITSNTRYWIAVAGSASTAPFEISLSSFTSCPPLGWDYYRVINVTNPTSFDVNNIPVRIRLNSSNFDFTHANIDGSDLRFYLAGCSTQLYYWIEYWDRSDNLGIVWVNVPELPSHSTVQIYMVYHNPSAGFDPVYYNASAIFLFIDTMETWTGWESRGSGVVTQVDNPVFTGSYSLEKNTNCDPNGGNKSIGVTLNSESFALDAYVYRGSDLSCAVDRIGVTSRSGNGYGVGLWHGSSRIVIDKRTNYNREEHYIGIGIDPQYRWYRLTMYWFTGGTIIGNAQELNGNLIGSFTWSDTSYNNFESVYVLGGKTYYVDNIKIYRIIPDPVNPEPLIQVGPEQT
ncbi:MAG: DUF2341 domain-containing protein [Desulfurococcales archaeon]|nr:DUF2341 domain-containing protein [Desulfurococcales archaeon]